MSDDCSKGIGPLILSFAESVSDADSAQRVADEAMDELLPLFSEHIHTSEQLAVMEYLCGSVYECTEGELFILEEMFQRAFGYSDGKTSRNLLFNLMNCSVACLRTTVDPELFGNVFDGLCSMAAEAESQGSLSKADSETVKSLILLRDGYTGQFRDMDEDGFFSLVRLFEDDDSGEICSLLEPILEDRHLGQDMDTAEEVSAFLNRLFGC